MRFSSWRQLVSFPAMLVSILFISPFFASLDVQQGGLMMLLAVDLIIDKQATAIQQAA
ncbi:MAG TPA: hypothetical protein VHW70_01010 [Edaphobacter sp.]|jgi:hypothetical protein|nr:hypothetical protein [Edaphobacter sp.]